MSSYYKYKWQSYHCDSCGWEGLGSEADENDEIDSFIDLSCPKCYRSMDCISFPTSEEVLEFGAEDEKAHETQRQEFISKVHALRLKDASQLPDISADKIIVTLREEVQATDEEGDIVLLWDGKEIWREMRTYEYYERYLELGEMLKEKYEERLVDFETEYTTYLGGDCSFAFDKVRGFRESLQT